MKKRNIIIFILVLLLVISSSIIIYINGDNYKYNNLYNNPIKMNVKSGDYTINEYKDHVTIVTYDGEDDIVDIPRVINNKKVYSIDDSAFYGNSFIKKVIIPDTVIRIGHQSFIGANKLEEVILPDNIRDIGGYSFEACTKLKYLYVKKNSKTDKALQGTVFKEFIKYK